MRGCGRGAGSGVSTGAVVCGAAIEPVISAVAWSRRSEILASCTCADLLACSRLAFSVVISLPSRAIDCCIAWFCSIAATSGFAGTAWRSRRSPVRRPPRRARPRKSPRRRAEHSAGGEAARQSAAASRAPAHGNGSTAGVGRHDRLDRRSRACPLQSRAFQCPAISAAIRRSAIRPWPGVASRAPSGLGAASMTGPRNWLFTNR